MTMDERIEGAGRTLQLADKALDRAIKGGDRAIFEQTLQRWFDANNHHNALLVAQIRRWRVVRCIS
jgi:hypothetical protein